MLREKLLEYKTITDTLITAITSEDVEKIDESFKSREELIEEINKISLDSKYFKAIGEELGLLVQDRQLKILVQNKKRELQLEINNIKDKVNANRSYGATSLRKYGFFNTKI